MRTVQLLRDAVTEQKFVVKANDELQFFFLLCGREEKVERKIVFELGDNATVDVRGVVLGGGASEIQLTTEMVHKGRNTKGRTTVKGVLTDAARAHVTGWIRIPKTGNNADAFLDERFLLLSPKARAKAEPMLEILANDVKASHAATVSRVDDEQLFYFASRGIAPVDGKQLLIEAFVRGVFDERDDSKIIDACQTQLHAMMNV